MTPLITACVALAFASGGNPDHAQKTCAAIEVLAPLASQDPWQMAALAWRESKFDPAVVSRTGCLGPMQVNPAWSPYTPAQIATYDQGVEAGLVAVLIWQSRKGDKWMHCYNSGNSCHAPRYVRQVEEIRVQLVEWSRVLGRETGNKKEKAEP